MHPHIAKLHSISQKSERIILGLMSGTSLDGLDIALCKISGQGENTQCEVLHFVTIEYCEEYRSRLRQVFSKQLVSLELVCLLNAWVGRYHAKLVNQAIAKMGYSAEQIDLIASHGQTIYHSPKTQHSLPDYDNATLQIGDGDHIAVLTNIITLSDFRQKHIAAGGQGAPLVMYGDYLLFHSETENRILLNIGGIANLTFLPRSSSFSDVVSSDIGPGNTIMDAYVQFHFQPLQFDKDGELARSGTVNKDLLSELLSSSFFSQGFPKTTGPELFNLDYLCSAQQKSGSTNIPPEDVLATLCEFSACCIAQCIVEMCHGLANVHVYLSGGGIHNSLLMQRIESLLRKDFTDISIGTTELLTLNPDAKEAVLFALLANQTLCSTATATDYRQNKTNAQNNLPRITMGKISFPD